MTEGIADLTDKEKEALRLLLAGHDAKSSAAQLDLSVHTINDRLRNARRKLDVSSSREAARILGDAEGGPPQNLAHTTIGMVPQAAATDNADLNKTKPKEAFGLSWLAGGILIMSVVIAAAIIGVIYISGSESSTSGTSASDQVASVDETTTSPTVDASAAAIARARRFLAAVDAGDWKRSWDLAGTFFQSQMDAAEWTALGEPVRKPLGTVESRRLKFVQKATSLPGAPDGNYEILQYETKFSEVDRLSTETVVVIQNGGGFDIAGYFIR